MAPESLGCRNGVVGLQRTDLILKPGLPAAYVLSGVFLFTRMTGRTWWTFSSCTFYSIWTPWEDLDIGFAGEESKHEGLKKWKVTASDKFADNTKLSGTVDSFWRRHAIHRDFDSLEEFAHVSLM